MVEERRRTAGLSQRAGIGSHARTGTDKRFSSPVITNPDDPKFDLEKYLDKVAKENP